MQIFAYGSLIDERDSSSGGILRPAFVNVPELLGVILNAHAKRNKKIIKFKKKTKSHTACRGLITLTTN